jgi:hypothetical protein
MPIHHLCLALLIASAALPGQPRPGVTGQNPPAPLPKPDAAPAVKAEDLPVSLDRIQQALARTPKLRFDQNDRPLFQVEVFGEKPTLDDILGPNWATGPSKYGGMTHQEFLNLVTPKDVQGYAAFSNEEAATVAATSFVLQWTLQRAIRKYQASQDAREREAARQEVLEALKALEDARAKDKAKRY